MTHVSFTETSPFFLSILLTPSRYCHCGRDRFFERHSRDAIAHGGPAGPAVGNPRAEGVVRAWRTPPSEKEECSIMSDTNNNPNSTADPVTSATPDEAVQILRALQARIQPPDSSRVAHIKSATLASVDPHFITASINAIGAIDAVQTAIGRTGEDVRQEAETAARWTAFTDELRTMLAASVGADRIRRQTLGLMSLQTYNICKQLNRDKTRVPLVGAHLLEMKRLNKLGTKSGKGSSSKPQNPGPATTSTPPVNAS